MFNTRRLDQPMWRVHATKPASWEKIITVTAAARPTGDALEFALVPNAAVVFRGAPLYVNRWGMRDRDYQLDKPPNTTRVALLGASYVMGSGVANDETFEAVLEERLNRPTGDDAGHRYEILNFAVDAYSPMQRLLILERKGFGFHPDVVFYVGHGTEGLGVRRYLNSLLEDGIEPPQPFVRQVLHAAGVHPGANLTRKQLDICVTRIVPWVYRQIVDQCRQRGVRPVWIHVPTLAWSRRDSVILRFMSMARRAGFDVVDLGDTYDGHDTSRLRLAEWDFHPNPSAHALIAARLHAELRRRPELLRPLPTSTATDRAPSQPR
jgi:hypothetical protein